MKTFLFLKIFALVFFILSPHTYGTATSIWIQSSESEFRTGTVQNISIFDTGKIQLSPRTEVIGGIERNFVWSLIEDPQNQVFAGTGDPATIYRIEKGSGAIELFTSDELYIQSLAIDTMGNIFAGTAPHGIIYKITSEGQTSVFCTLPASYIWDIVIDRDFNIFAATGTDGILYKISPEGNASIFFDSPETNIMNLLIDQDNNIYAGTEPSGLIYKISPSGEAKVLYDASEDEIHCLAMDSAGNLYAGTASGAKAQIPPPERVMPAAQPPAIKPPAQEGITWDLNLSDEMPLVSPPAIPYQRQPSRPGRSLMPGKGISISPNYVYKITRAGQVSKIFETDQALILDISFNDRDELFVVTGNESGVYQIIQNEVSARLLHIDEIQILCCHYTRDNELYLGTGSTGKVYRIHPTFAEKGVFTSSVFDTTALSNWGTIYWEGTCPEGTKIILATRSGNCENPDTTWSKWTKYTAPGKRITNPPARFIQYKVTLETSYPDITPSVNLVSISYLPENLPPEIKLFEIDQDPSAPQEKQHDARPGVPAETKPRILSSDEPHYKLAQKKIQWEVEDPNNDNVKLKIYYKGTDEKAWKVIDENTQKKGSYTWNTLRLPDGKYHIKLFVTDSPDNPPETALSVEKETQPFVIDNSKPVIKSLSVVAEGNGQYLISGMVKDDLSIITNVKYTLDGKDWISAYPEDGIFDAMEESFRIVIQNLPPGSYTTIINAFDAEGNIGIEKVMIEVK